MRSTLLRDAVRTALYGGATLALVASPAVLAQDQDDAEQLETITVVGSRIKRVDIETSQPVFVVEKEDLQKAGLANVGDLVTNLVYADNSTVTTVTNNTNGGDNTVQISLRQLTAERTLVLVNGRRWVGNLDGRVDLNNIPLAVVERIEILKDGASAIYGSDAIAGVVNIVTRENYDGMEANAYFGEYEEGDGRTESYDYTLGASTDRASIMANLAYTKQEPIFADSRERTQEPVVGTGVLFGSASGERGPLSVPGNPGCGLCVLIPGRPGTAVGDFRPYTAADNYNFAPVNYVLQAFDRWSVYVQARYNLTDSVTFFSMAQYIKRRGSQQLAEVPLTANAAGTAGPQWDFGTASVPTDNVFNPFGRPVTNVNFRMRALGARRNEFDYDTWAYTGGFEGTFDAMERSFSWDVAYQYQTNDQDSLGFGYVNLFNLRNGLGSSFRDAGGNLRCGTPGNVIAGCVPFNVFGGPDLGVGAGVISQDEQAAMLNYVGYTLQNQAHTDITNYTANITGDVFDLPAGPLAFAMGFEYRGTDGKFTPDSLVAEGGSSNNFTEPTSGNQKVDEFYGELNVPIVKDLPFAEILELNLAGRYSDYSSSGRVGVNDVTAEIGDTTNFKAGFRWKPIADLLVRGNWAETFRAPSVLDLYGGGAESFPTVNDPCRNALAGNTNLNIYATLTPDQQQNCIDSGVPAGGYNQPNAQIRTLLGGNTFLQPELGTNRTLGLVYSPGWLEGFDFYLDWYNIKLENALSQFGGTAVLNRCIRNGEEVFCNFVTRTATGETSTLRTAQFNAASLEVEGWDIGLNYRLDTEWGKFRWVWNTAYLSELLFSPDSITPADNLAGETDGFDAGFWRIRSNFATNWALGDFDATWNLRYFSPLEEDCTGASTLFEDGLSTVEFCDENPDGPEATPAEVNNMGSVTYHDFQVGWNAPWNGRIAGGVRNAFDKQPPVSFNAFANSTLQGYDLPDGRFWYVSYSQKF